MKKHFFSLLLFLLVIKSSSAQWWNTIFLDSTYNLNTYTVVDVIFLEENEVIYSLIRPVSASTGPDKRILFTNNSGNTWSPSAQYTGPLPTGFYSLHAVSEQHTYYNLHYRLNDLKIERSIDGINWEMISEWNSSGQLIDFCPIDTSNNYLICNSFSNSYLSYIDKYAYGVYSTAIDTFNTEKPFSIDFPVIDTGYFAAYDLQNPNKYFIFKSNNGGYNWTKSYTDSTIKINKIFFTSVNTGYAVCDLGKMLRTMDGGNNWQILNTTTTVNLNDLFFFNDSSGNVAGNSGTILHTNDAGITWTQQTTNALPGSDFTKIFFVNDTIGFARSGNNVFKIKQGQPNAVWDIYSYYDDLQIYPNPTIKHFFIDSKMKIARIEILDAAGKIMYSDNLNAHMAEIDFDSEAKGIYFISVQYENGMFGNKKIIITE